MEETMGLLGSVFRGVTGPLRGITRVLRGDIKGGLGAFGDTLSLAPVALGATGVGLPIAAGVGAAAGALQKFDDEDFSLGSVVGGAAKGALTGAGTHGVGKGISGILSRGGAASAPIASAAPGSAIPESTSLVSRTPNVASLGGRAGTAAGNIASTVGETVTDEGGGGLLRGIGRFLAKHPDVPAEAISTGANLYGNERALAFRREEAEKERQLDQLRMLFQLSTASPVRF